MGGVGSQPGTVADLMVRLGEQFGIVQMEVRTGKSCVGEPLDLDEDVTDGGKYHIVNKTVAGARAVGVCVRGDEGAVWVCEWGPGVTRAHRGAVLVPRTRSARRLARAPALARSRRRRRRDGRVEKRGRGGAAAHRVGQVLPVAPA